MGLTNSEILEIAKTIPGWMRPDELTWLIRKAASMPKGSRWVELGSYCGRSLVAVGLALPPECTLVSVDQHWGLYDGTEVEEHDGTIVINLAEVQYMIATLRNAKPRKGMKGVWNTSIDGYIDIELHGICATTENAAKNFKHNYFDVVFIDADHSYKSCANDIETWLPLIRNGGLICGHDYTKEFSGVVRAVDERCPDSVNVDTIWLDYVDDKVKTLKEDLKENQSGI